MANPGLTPTYLDAILPVLRARIVSVTGLDDTVVWETKKAKVPFNAQADHFVTIRPRGQQCNRPIEQGAGRLDLRATRRISITAYTRVELDEHDRDTNWLRNQTLGHLQLERKILDAVTTFKVIDANGNLLALPIRPGVWQEPDEEKEDPAWGSSTLDIEITFVVQLDQSYQ